MANTTRVAAKAALAPSRDDIARVEEWTREPFAYDDGTLRPGTALRRAFDAALEEIEAGHEHPSAEWRQRYSLMLGLERLLSEEQPKLADGAELSAHQVDVLSGTLTALVTEAEQKNGHDPDATDMAAVVEDGRQRRRAEDRDDDLLDDEATSNGSIDEEVLDEEEDWLEEELSVNGQDGVEEQLPEQPEDPSAGRRFWFEHATGSGKTVAAVGFVDASRTGGVLILTHRRHLVRGFLGGRGDRG